MIRLAIAVSLALPLATPGTAQGVFIGPPDTVTEPQALTGQRKRIARDLVRFGFAGTDLSRLSNRQVSLIANAIHSNRSQGDVTARIRSILSGGGLFQRTLDGIGQGG